MKLITNVANANLFDLRNRCPIYHTTDATEVILHRDFYSVILTELGLKKFTDIAEEKLKIDEVLA